MLVKQICAKQEWVDTGMSVEAGDVLSFSAEGTWVDLWIRCSANGYWAPLFYMLNKPPRIPDKQRYFRLMGRIARDGLQPKEDDALETFPIGKAADITARWAGRLFVFANDRRGFYGNNRGSVSLTVVRRSNSSHEVSGN